MDINCAVFVDWGTIPQPGNYGSISAALPCYPEEVGEQLSASWATQDIVGRTGSIVAYTGKEDTQVSFNFDMHREQSLANNGTGAPQRPMEDIVRILKSACYPLYDSSLLQPPLVMFQFGKLFISGRLTSLGVTRKGPIIDDEYALYSISISMAVMSNKVNGKDDIIAMLGAENTIVT